MPEGYRSAVLGRINAVVEPVARRGWSGPPFVGWGLTVVETTGRRTGVRRSRPLLAGRIGDLVVVGTVRRRSDWVANVRAHPAADVWLDGERVAAAAATLPLPVGWLTLLRTT